MIIDDRDIQGTVPCHDLDLDGVNDKTLTEGIQSEVMSNEDLIAWYVMRDLKRTNAADPAYKMLKREGFDVYTPMEWRIRKCLGQTFREEMPVIRDMVFVHSTKELLSPILLKTPTLQYRYFRGGGYREAMTVRDSDMDRFIKASTCYGPPRFYKIDEITPDMYGRKVKIIGGPLDGTVVPLLKMQGSRKRRIIVDLPLLLAVSVEVSPDFIEFV